MKNFKTHFVSLFAVSVFLLLAVGSDDDTKKNADGTEKSARQIQIEKQFSLWDGSHNNLTKLIKKAMNDASSFEHVETTYSDKGDHLIVLEVFRGKNAFGGVVKNSIKAEVDLDGNITKILEDFK